MKSKGEIIVRLMSLMKNILRGFLSEQEVDMLCGELLELATDIYTLKEECGTLENFEEPSHNDMVEYLNGNRILSEDMYKRLKIINIIQVMRTRLYNIMLKERENVSGYVNFNMGQIQTAANDIYFCMKDTVELFSGFYRENIIDIYMSKHIKPFSDYLERKETDDELVTCYCCDKQVIYGNCIRTQTCYGYYVCSEICEAKFNHSYVCNLSNCCGIIDDYKKTYQGYSYHSKSLDDTFSTKGDSISCYEMAIYENFCGLPYNKISETGYVREFLDKYPSISRAMMNDDNFSEELRNFYLE